MIYILQEVADVPHSSLVLHHYYFNVLRLCVRLCKARSFLIKLYINITTVG